MVCFENKRFSWLIFTICLLEFLLWSAAPVSALSSGDNFTTEDIYRNHIQKDKDHYVHANRIEQDSGYKHEVDKQNDSIQKMIELENQALSSGRDSLQPDSKWNIITWSLMTAFTLALGLANGQKPVSPRNKQSQKTDNDSESSASAIIPIGPVKVNHTTGLSKEVVEVQKLSQLGETENCEQTSQNSQSEMNTNLSAADLSEMSDEEVLQAINTGRISQYDLEDRLEDTSRAVTIRRRLLAQSLVNSFDINAIPFENYDYDQVKGKCCENVIGYVPIPVGVVGPVLMNGKLWKVPMATTEGCLVASTQRGMKAITSSGGANAVVVANGMTRGPLVRMPNVKGASEVKAFVESPNGFKQIESAFNSTSNYARLRSCKVTLAGRNIYIRFKAFTGDAMGMNMISKGVEKVLELLKQNFMDLEVVAISGNYCTDKKPAAINWIEGRGRSVTADAVIKGEIIESVLKTTVQSLVDVNINKNLVGSAMAGSIGGFNAHAANIVTAIYLATGQDPAQNVESSNCITLMEAINDGKDLYMSVTMPSIEIGTVGGGTGLPAQSACLEMMSCKGNSQSEPSAPGSNGDHFAQLIATSVMAGELSLISAIAAGQLVKSHMQFNRAKPSGLPTSNASQPICLAKL